MFPKALVRKGRLSSRTMRKMFDAERKELTVNILLFGYDKYPN